MHSRADGAVGTISACLELMRVIGIGPSIHCERSDSKASSGGLVLLRQQAAAYQGRVVSM